MDKSKAFARIEANLILRIATVVSAFVLVGGVVVGVVDQFTKFPLGLRIAIGTAAGVLVVVWLLALLSHDEPEASIEQKANIQVALGAVKIELLTAELDTKRYLNGEEQPYSMFNDYQFRQYEQDLSLNPKVHSIVARAVAGMRDLDNHHKDRVVSHDRLADQLVLIQNAIDAIEKA
jgi:hypothetical protein